MKKKKKLLLIVMLIAVMALPITVNAAIKLNKKKVTLTVGKTVQLKVKGTKAKVKWSSSNKKIATVSSKGKVKAKKVGKATITAKIGKKKYRCKITVNPKPGEGGTTTPGDGSTTQSDGGQSATVPKKTIQQLDAETLANAKTIITLNGDAMNTWLFGRRANSKTDASGNMIWSIVSNKNGTVDYINIYRPGTNELIACTDVINNFSDMTLHSSSNGDHIAYLMGKGQYDFAKDPNGALVCWNYWGHDLYPSFDRTKADFETIFNGTITEGIYNKLMGYLDYPAVSGKGKDLVIIYGKNANGVLTARYAGYYIFKNSTYELIGVASDNPTTYGKLVTW